MIFAFYSLSVKRFEITKRQNNGERNERQEACTYAARLAEVGGSC